MYGLHLERRIFDNILYEVDRSDIRQFFLISNMINEFVDL
jgi:hypothetical protein